MITSLAIAGQLLVGRTILDLLGRQRPSRRRGAGALPGGLGVLLMIAALSQASRPSSGMPLGEKVSRRTMDEILDVATEVELEDLRGLRVPRPPCSGRGWPRAAVGRRGVRDRHHHFDARRASAWSLVLITVAPVLVPFAVLGYVPIAFVNVRNNRARYALEGELTELQRDARTSSTCMTDRTRPRRSAPTTRARRCAAGTPSCGTFAMLQLRALVRRRLTLTTSDRL